MFIFSNDKYNIYDKMSNTIKGFTLAGLKYRKFYGS
jgi:hypothetical protein